MLTKTKTQTYHATMLVTLGLRNGVWKLPAPMMLRRF